MTSFDVVLVPFPFSRLEATKKRPCLVLARVQPKRLPPSVIVAMMTSQIQRLFPHDVVLKDWSHAGLPKETLVRLCKVVTLEESMIEKRLGTLAAADKRRVKTEWSGLLGKL